MAGRPGPDARVLSPGGRRGSSPRLNPGWPTTPDLQQRRDQHKQAAQVARVTPPHPADFFTRPPDKVLGVVLHLHGDLFRPRFGPEAGLQIVKDPRAEHVALIETSHRPFAQYQVPAGIERAGGIKARGEAVIRTFDPAQSHVTDSLLGERPWTGTTLARCLEVLTEERLDRAIEQATA